MKRSMLFVPAILGVGVILAGIGPDKQDPEASGRWRLSPAPRRHAPAIVRERHGKNATSSNWSGYAVTGADGTVSRAIGSWVVPYFTCDAAAPSSYSSYWVGIDGYTSNTVEQIGIDANCVSGQSMPTYSAWFEFYPHWPYTINDFPLNAGDTITAEVKGGGKAGFTLTLTNSSVWLSQKGKSVHPSFSTTSKMQQARQSSAEWIVEAPWSSGVLPLAPFVAVNFSACSATMNGRPGPVTLLDPNSQRIDMVDQDNSSVLKAQTIPTVDGSGFKVVWRTAGP